MSQPEYLLKHILICNDDSCADYGAKDVRKALKSELRERDIRQIYREGECSCIGLCRKGVNVVIWPEGTYLAGVTEKDVPRLVDYLQGKGPRLDECERRASEKIILKKESP